MAASKIKASDRSKVCQQVVTILKKEYGSRVPANDHDVLDTLLFSVCLQNSNYADAESALQSLKDEFFDYNELRVSSITEIQNSFVNMSEPEWRAMRVRDIIQFVFESGYSFEVEDLKKKTIDAAEKQLKKVKSLTPFNISYTLLFSLGSHLVPIDENTLQVSNWLGLLEPGTKIKAAGEQFKGAVRKSDVPLFFHLISKLAGVSQIQKTVASADGPDKDDPLKNLTAVPGRLKDLLAGKITIPRKPKPKPATKKSEKSASKTAKKSTPEVKDKKATTASKSVGTKKKSVEKSTTASKKPVAAKKAVAKKKTVAKKTVAKKTVTKKTSSAKTKTAKKSTKKKTTKKGRK